MRTFSSDFVQKTDLLHPKRKKLGSGVEKQAEVQGLSLWMLLLKEEERQFEKASHFLSYSSYRGTLYKFMKTQDIQ